MGYDGQFEDFNPLETQVPSIPYGELPGIAERARSFLKGRSSDDLIHRSKVLDKAMMTSLGMYELNSKGDVQFSFVSSDFETLKKCFLAKTEAVFREDFAIVALWRVIDAVRFGTTPGITPASRYYSAGSAMSEAGEAVAYAESLLMTAERGESLANLKLKEIKRFAGAKGGNKKHRITRVKKRAFIEDYKKNYLLKTCKAAGIDLAREHKVSLHTSRKWISETRKTVLPEESDASTK